jgi:hypothetical protein
LGADSQSFSVADFARYFGGISSTARFFIRFFILDFATKRFSVMRFFIAFSIEPGEIVGSAIWQADVMYSHRCRAIFLIG